MKPTTIIHLKRGKEESLQRFHPWIFSGAVHHIEGNPQGVKQVANYESMDIEELLKAALKKMF